MNSLPAQLTAGLTILVLVREMTALSWMVCLQLSLSQEQLRMLWWALPHGNRSAFLPYAV